MENPFKNMSFKEKIGHMLEQTYSFNLEMEKQKNQRVNRLVEVMFLYSNELAYHLMMIYVELEKEKRDETGK
jgi:hypothetical protein